ncbi:Uncharacterised protein [Mycobacteroides abscessus subsp. abscessus]|nr:Uncharacterised protein [Mycobacteroides abscessus subsp. abscessus]
MTNNSGVMSSCAPSPAAAHAAEASSSRLAAMSPGVPLVCNPATFSLPVDRVMRHPKFQQ